MLQTVFISIHTRNSSTIFKTDFNVERSEASQIIAFLESKNLHNIKYELHKCFDYDPTTQFFLPHFSLIEVDNISKDLCK